MPYRIGLAGIGADSNPYGPAVADNPENRRITLSRSDPRQRGEFAAAFALGYLASATARHIWEVVVGHIAGPLGVIAAPDDHFPAGRRYPVLQLVAELARFEGSECRQVLTSNPGIVGLACSGESESTLFIANVTDGTVPVAIPALHCEVEAPVSEELALPPFTARLIRI